MKNSIKNLKAVFSATEKLSTKELCHVKGGGEDLRRPTAVASTTTTTTTTTLTVAAKI
jgi:hypothetical protein